MGGAAAAPGAPPGRVGPNAVIQMAAALRARGGSERAAQVFASAGLIDLLGAPPDAMVDERLVARLHRVVAGALGPEEAAEVALDAGRRTAEYILAHRIPRPAQGLLKALPARPAARLLATAIARNAWTFAGSGTFAVRPGRPLTFEITANPVATPGCPWHRGVFEGLFRALAADGAAVSESACCARGAPACIFQVAV